jgi:glutamate synthase (NADPH/NADH) large chain
MNASGFGLFDPALEKDSCGVGFIADIKGRKSHRIVEDALTILVNLEHRGAVGADPRAGDGAGILVQTPHKFLAKKAAELGITLPPPGEYAVGALFMPHDKAWRAEIMEAYVAAAAREGMTVLGWRDVPIDNSTLGETVKPTEPWHMQVFLARGAKIASEEEFERRLYILRKTISGIMHGKRGRSTSHYYPVSLSCRTMIYKGMFLADQLGAYYPDLHDPDFESALALVHQRFSTNTFPAWSLAHPYRMVAHNGEINTLRGNNNWMAARQALASSSKFGDDIEKLWPISYEGQSDTACFDNALEFLTMGGYSLPHAMMMMIPEAWAGNQSMNEERRAFYEYNAALMEPWDGPAAIAFTDGRQIGATLDRNGLRPARYVVTRDDRIVMASEVGVLTIPEEDIVTKWRLQPGKMLLVDLEQGRLIPDEEIKSQLAQSHPYKEWLERTQIQLENLAETSAAAPISNLSLLDRQQLFGYTQEDLKILMTPMGTTGEEAVGSMGNDTPISALSDRAKLLFTYFKQNFAQVTNPPIDPIREELVMSLVSIIGPRPNLFDLEGTSKTKRLEVHQPIDFGSRPRSLQVAHDRHHLAGRRRRRRHGRSDRRPVRPRRDRGARRHQYRHPVRPPRQRRPHPDPGAARLRRRASSSHSRGPAHLGRHRGGIGRAARGAPLRLPRRLRRRSDQPLSRLRDARRHEERAAAEARREGNRQALHQVDRQGTAQGDVQDGHLDLPVLLRRPDLRRHRAQVRLRRQIFHWHRHPHRGRRT